MNQPPTVSNETPPAVVPAPLEAALPVPEALGVRMIKGAALVVVQSVLAQALTFAARIVVYRELSADDVAIAAFALSACSFFTWLQPNVGDVLIQKQQHFRRWANSGFWLLAFAGLGQVVAACIVAPIIGLAYGSWIVGAIVILTVLSSAYGGLMSVWTAEHTIAFNFRLMTIVATACAIIGAVITVAMALLHMGAWTMAVPAVVSNLLMFLIYWRISRFRDHRPVERRWRLLLGPSYILSLAGFFSALLTQADNFFLGIFKKEQLGAYALAYALSLQLIQLVSRSLRGVLLPALSVHQGSVATRNERLLETVRIACLLTMPAALLLIPAAPALVIQLMSARWAASVRMFQIFQCGMGFTIIHVIAFTAMQSWGLFRRYLVINIIMGTFFFAAMWIAAALADAPVVAGTVSVIYILTAVVSSAASVWPAPALLQVKLAAAAFLPWVIAGVAAAGAYAVARWTHLPEQDLRFAAVALATGGILYAAGALLLMPHATAAARARAAQFLAHRRRPRPV